MVLALSWAACATLQANVGATSSTETLFLGAAARAVSALVVADGGIFESKRAHKVLVTQKPMS
jgi:hypothetical protein